MTKIISSIPKINESDKKRNGDQFQRRASDDVWDWDSEELGGKLGGAEKCESKGRSLSAAWPGTGCAIPNPTINGIHKVAGIQVETKPGPHVA